MWFCPKFIVKNIYRTLTILKNSQCLALTHSFWLDFKWLYFVLVSLNYEVGRFENAADGKTGVHFCNWRKINKRRLIWFCFVIQLKFIIYLEYSYENLRSPTQLSYELKYRHKYVVIRLDYW